MRFFFVILSRSWESYDAATWYEGDRDNELSLEMRIYVLADDENSMVENSLSEWLVKSYMHWQEFQNFHALKYTHV